MLNRTLQWDIDVSRSSDNLSKYLHTFQLTNLYFMYFVVMIILTLDRCFEFPFSMKYSLIWSSKKTLIILGMFLCISLMYFICFLPFSVKIFSYRKYLIGYVYAPVAYIYSFLASLTYYQIFKKIKENRKKARKLKEYIENRRKCRKLREYISKEQPTQRKKQIQIFLPSFIILTFILFCIFPIFLTLLHDFIFTDTGWLMRVLLVLMELGWMVDPLI